MNTSKAQAMLDHNTVSSCSFLCMSLFLFLSPFHRTRTRNSPLTVIGPSESKGCFSKGELTANNQKNNAKAHQHRQEKSKPHLSTCRRIQRHVPLSHSPRSCEESEGPPPVLLSSLLTLLLWGGIVYQSNQTPRVCRSTQSQPFVFVIIVVVEGLAMRLTILGRTLPKLRERHWG